MTVLELCPCGEPLHYTDPTTEQAIRAFVAILGETQPVTVQGLGTWMVPRHYVALHGLKAAELPELAGRYGWVKR